jgi:hypothetical protein
MVLLILERIPFSILGEHKPGHANQATRGTGLE